MNENILIDIFSIIGDKTQLLARSLLPDSWDLEQSVEGSICTLGTVSIELTELDIDCWPSQYERNTRTLRLSEKFLNDQHYTRDEILATIIHEIGHLVNPSPDEYPENLDAYVSIIDGEASAESEPYADRFAADAGFRESLINVLKKLAEDRRFRSDPKLIERRIRKLTQ